MFKKRLCAGAPSGNDARGAAHEFATSVANADPPTHAALTAVDACRPWRDFDLRRVAKLDAEQVNARPGGLGRPEDSSHGVGAEVVRDRDHSLRSAPNAPSPVAPLPPKGPRPPQRRRCTVPYAGSVFNRISGWENTRKGLGGSSASPPCGRRARDRTREESPCTALVPIDSVPLGFARTAFRLIERSMPSTTTRRANRRREQIPWPSAGALERSAMCCAFCFVSSSFETWGFLRPRTHRQASAPCRWPPPSRRDSGSQSATLRSVRQDPSSSTCDRTRARRAFRLPPGASPPRPDRRYVRLPKCGRGTSSGFLCRTWPGPCPEPLPTRILDRDAALGFRPLPGTVQSGPDEGVANAPFVARQQKGRGRNQQQCELHQPRQGHRLQ